MPPAFLAGLGGQTDLTTQTAFLLSPSAPVEFSFVVAAVPACALLAVRWVICRRDAGSMHRMTCSSAAILRRSPATGAWRADNDSTP